MMTLINKNNLSTHIFAETIDDGCIRQLQALINNESYVNEKIRIMPDCHAGKGSVIGFTSTYSTRIIPNTVGVDISCGMLVINLGKVKMDLRAFDNMVQKYIPAGMDVQEDIFCHFDQLEQLYCFPKLQHLKRILCSIGTLGGGNHFIELDKNEWGEIFLVIHTGSRNLGKQVCEYYQNVAIQYAHGKGDYEQRRQSIIEEYKQQGKMQLIQQALYELDHTWLEIQIPDAQTWIEGVWLERYIADMKICAEFAHANRESIAEILISKYFKGKHLSDFSHFETLHNYIDFQNRIIRKGAVSAQKGEQLIIPMNMRDGSLICIGKGNPDWNFSAPHGAGRVMSRIEAKKSLSLDDFRNSMQGIYTTTVNKDTLDEAPMVYKPMEEIMRAVHPTVDIVDIIHPIYNFKAAEATNKAPTWHC